MKSTSMQPESVRGAGLTWLRRIGTCGAVLALTILGASMLLRLTATLGADGHTVSTLPLAIEQATRLVHRLAATGLGLLALFSVVQSWMHRSSSVQPAKPTVWIVVATVILAVIGPLTPGYKLGAITVVNVGCGMILLMAYWWLRESVCNAAAVAGGGKSLDVFSWMALLAFVLHVGTGAAASAWEMHGVRWPAFVHLGSLVVCIILVVAIVLEHRGTRSLAGTTTAVGGLLVIQLLIGYGLMWQDPRPVGWSFLHGMLSPALAVVLVSLLQRSRVT